MKKIIARFEIKLQNHIMVMWPESEDIKFEFNINDSHIAIKLLKCFSNKYKYKNDKYYTEPIYDIVIDVSRKHSGKIPDVIILPSGGKNFSKKIDYFDSILKEFSKAAYEAYKRLIVYLKYVLYAPYLIEYPPEHPFFHNATWINNNGDVLGKNTTKLNLNDAYEMDGILPIGKLTQENSEYLKIILENPVDPLLYSRFLSDAVTAFFDKDLHRTILELAIACEILVKRFYFSEGTPAGAAFDYLEDKSQVNLKVTDLIDKIAKEAFGKSFKEEQPKHFTNIEYLFRCRNKIAHRGSLEYRDKHGELKITDIKTVVGWFVSVMNLHNWILTLKKHS